MKFDLVTPCKLCPFRRGGLVLEPGRNADIARPFTQGGQGIFVCHKTATTDADDGDFVAKDDGTSQHCAGALIFAEKQDTPTQFMRIAGRLGSYDPRRLKGHDEVYDSLDEMEEAARAKFNEGGAP